jgi:Plasma-membrane choline transporter
MTSRIPIVQGIAVQQDGSSKYQASYSSYDQGVAQPNHAVPTSYDGVSPQDLQQMRATPIKQYQDVIWAVLFILHLIAVVVVVLLEFSTSTLQGSALQGNIIFMTCTTGLAAVGLSAMALSFMMQHAKTLVEMALIFSVASSLAVGIMGFVLGSVLMGCLGLFSFAVGCCYAKIVWPRIPFAAANLNTALSAVRENMGLTVVSFGFTLVAFGWTIFWFLGVGNSFASSNGAVIFLLVSLI